MMVPPAEFAPDRGPFDPQSSDNILNAIPIANGYGPWPMLTEYSDALPAAPRGYFMTMDTGGGIHIFSATATKLYKLDVTTRAWTDVTRASGGDYTDIGADEQWRFIRHGNIVFAVSLNNVVQTYTIGSSTDFANITATTGTVPQSRVVTVIGDHVVLGEHNTQSRMMTWSGQDAPLNWLAQEKNSSFQVFPDGDEIVAIVGFEDGGLVLQRMAIREMLRSGNSYDPWAFQKVEDRLGSISPQSVVSAGRDVFFRAEDGFYRYGRPSAAIGANRVDEFFLADVAPDYRIQVEGTIDPIKHRVLWRYRSQSLVSTSPVLTDRILLYDYVLDRWSLVNQRLTGFFSAATPGYTLETLDNVSSSIDDLQISLDSRAWAAGVPLVAGFTEDFKLGFFAGDSAEAIMQTTDAQTVPGRRARVRGLRPTSDVSTIYGRVSRKDRHGGAREWTGEAVVNADTGVIPVRSAGLLHRAEIRIPAASTWSFLHGVEVDAIPEGMR